MISILGSGSWGTALGQVLADNHQEVLIWGRNKFQVDDININHRNSTYFDTSLNPSLIATNNIEDVKDSDIIIFATPVKSIKEVLLKLQNVIKHKVLLINVSKGFVDDLRISQYLKMQASNICLDVVSLIGPSHAEEVVERLLTTVNSVCENEEYAKRIQELFSNDYFRVYRNDDVIGAELASATKNIMAIASGIITGMGQGDNCRAGLMTRGLAEMTRFGTYFGGKQETYLGLNGVGDLIVTCSSIHSRNYQAGLSIGKKDSAKNFIKENKMTVEGINTTKVVYELANKYQINMPITTKMYEILFEDLKPSDGIKQLMARSLKKE